jgi:hypothetical protein
MNALDSMPEPGKIPFVARGVARDAHVSSPTPGPEGAS